MGNEYNVLESGSIECACGGKVTLASSVPNLKIAGAKPLYLKDILGAPVACPRSKNPCTKVTSISIAGTETNVSATGETYLLRTDGFKTDKGRAVLLKAPGQGTSKISSIPSLENQDVIPEEEPLKEEKVVLEKEKKEKYQIHLLRKCQDIYKPIRPSRTFRNSIETHQTELLDEFNDTSIHSHTYAFVYITQNNKTTEYQVYSKGNIYSESTKEIFYQNKKTKIISEYIPLYEDDNIDISYSNIRLQDDNDIKKLKKLSLTPTSPDGENAFYIKDIDDIDLRELTKEDIKNKKQKEIIDNTKNIVCVINDILAEIEDLYLEYHTRYKIAYRKNHDIIEDIKKRNKYPYTIINIIDYFYVDKKEEKRYKEETEKLKQLYNQLASLILNDESLIAEIFEKDNDISKILDKDEKKVALSYMQQVQLIKSDFFEDKNDSKREETLKKAIITKRYFKTGNEDSKFIYMTRNITGQNKRVGYGYSKLEFNSANQVFTNIKDDARLVLAHLTFALFFSEEFEDELKTLNCFGKIDKLRDQFLIQIKAIAPLPNISDSSKEDVREAVEKDSSPYWECIGTLKSSRDKYLDEYENLDYTKKIKSFEQKGDSVKFDTKYLYYDKSLKYYKKEKEFSSPKKLLEKIVAKLKDDKLQKILNIYKNITNTNKFDYVVSAMNITYMLCTPRTFLDEETDKTTFLNDSLNHIYDFVVDLTHKRINLRDEEKDKLNKEFQISNSYSSMQTKLILNGVFFPEEKGTTPKGITFLEQFATKENKEEIFDENKDKYKTVTGLPQNLKSKERQIYETIKKIEGVTSGFEKILEEINRKSEYADKTLSEITISRIGKGLKLFSNILVYASAIDYLFINNETKDIKSKIGFVNDMLNISVMIGGFIEKNPKVPLAVLQNFLKAKALKSVSLSSQKLLTYAKDTVLKKLSVITIVVTSLIDSVNLYRREDFDALTLTTLASSINIALIICSPTLPMFVVGVLITIITGIILNEIIDSDVDIYIKKSLLYKTIDFSIFKELFDKEQSKKYQAYYLFETTNQNEELKTICNDGFNNPKRLIEFVGSNYKGKENYFDTALNNELSFLKSAIYGYKLELLGRRRKRKLKNGYGLDTQLWQDTFVKIPKIFLDDKNFQFIFVEGKDYRSISKKGGFFTEEENYYVFDLLDQKFKTLLELNTINHKKASIIILSSQVELKYEFTYDYREIVYLDAVNFQQVSFTPQDVENLKQFIKKEEDKK